MRVYEYVVLEWPKVEHPIATKAGKPEIITPGGNLIGVCVAPDEEAVKRRALWTLSQDTDIERLERIEVLVRPFG